MPEKKSDKNLSARDKAVIVASWLAEKKAKDILAIEVAPLNPVCDAMILASAVSLRQAKALADHVLLRSGEEGFSYLGMEGYGNGQWILLDLNDVMVHIFQEDLRPFYNLEGLWSEGKRIPLPALPKPEKRSEPEPDTSAE
ncbi:iojap-like protein [Solidesulfovibrio carbinoliphilus subsp. oakridgensis]|uniref:Ribosomal silencing factor RsfS n=1 Tax=Solidesulfovibrio carbinoliphilus subsp. oakridgensis TaxID=694327 RepID=G7Q440_9BACT|nr:ribosome silencing factor [Solidesulfovibrio carbinoliphilus]EHJ46830.1 iojap-like protein [Solidesulfovibrio carbinoliphilus subsp. oakridgensis]